MASATPQKSAKKGRGRRRAPATGALAEPVVAESASLAALSAFSPSGDLFAHVSLAVDKHRLRVYNALTGRSQAEVTLQDARAHSLHWLDYEAADSAATPTPKKRKKNRKDGDVSDAAPQVTDASQRLLAIGLSSGSIALFSPSQNEIVRTLAGVSSTTPILSLTSQDGITLWTSSEDGALRSWDVKTGALNATWKTTSATRTPYSAIITLPYSGETRPATATRILAAHHSIRLLAVTAPNAAAGAEQDAPSQIAQFTGHASPVVSLDIIPSPASNKSTRFVSFAQGDRILSIWDVPSAEVTEGTMIASIPLDSDVRAVSLPRASSTSSSPILAVSASGTVRIFPAPSTSSTTPVTSIDGTTISPSGAARVVAARFLPELGQVQVVRLVNGVRPVFDNLTYMDADGSYLAEISLAAPSAVSLGFLAASEPENDIRRQKYTEPQNLRIRSGLELPDEAAGEDALIADGALDAELAELSLEQRLAASTPANPAPPPGMRIKRRGKGIARHAEVDGIVPAPLTHAKDSLTLTRTLTQALHSSDTKLLNTVLIHTNQTLITNTVRRLPSQLTVPLVLACVERLNKGQKSGGDGASAQRGAALIKWIRAVLVAHTAYLMTVPDLVTRLATLHRTLTTRLTLQERLLSLSGRLDLVLAQVELRSSNAPGPAPLIASAPYAKSDGSKVVNYVEGESSDEEAMDVVVEVGDDEGSVEDVELDGASDDDEDDEDEDEDDESDDEEDEDSEGGGPRANAFVDMEAEETWGEDESEDSDE